MKIKKGNKLYLKVGSLGWSNYLGIPIYFIVIGSIALVITFVKGGEFRNYAIYTIISIIGILLYIYQNDKLKFRSLDLNVPTDQFIENAKMLLEREGWIIEYDNQKYLQAIYRTGLFRLDLLTIIKFKHRIEYNLIHHPQDHNSIASLIDLNLKGKKTLNQIITYT